MVVIFVTALLQLPVWAKGKPPWLSDQKVTVMTQNLYVGAAIQNIVTVPDDQFIGAVMAALQQVADNNFPERAMAIAAEIVEKNPHLVGLQEVYNITINGQNYLPPYRNYLEDLMQALEYQGASYYVAAIVKNTDLTVAFDGFPTIRVIDRDVILAREDVMAWPLNLPVCPIQNQSEDGCNYSLNASKSDTPIGDIEFLRGYVAVDAVIDSLPVRFFNTHLEVRYPADDPAAPGIQAAQAYELINSIGVLNMLNQPAGPVIVVGDINSSPEDEVIIIEDTDDGFMFIVPPYMQFTGGVVPLFIDTWTLRPGKPKGFTCCYEEDLSEPADLYERIDMIFTNELPTRVKANVVGNDPADQTGTGLWPSDHAGVAARLWYENNF
jgi:endonuclease/exonuclease/phosphatase family metal-dependent hydrolase